MISAAGSGRSRSSRPSPRRASAILVAYLMLFGLDRVWDTPGWLRVGLFAGGGGGCAICPFFLHRWVWRHRRLEQLARLLAAEHPRIGDQLLGIIELAQQRIRAGAVARAVRGGDPGSRRATPSRCDFQRRRAASPASALAGAGRRAAGGRDRAAGALPGRGRECLAAVPRSLGSTPALHVHARSRSCPTAWSWPTASRSR